MNSVDEVSVEAARLGASEPKGVWTGERYLESLMDGRRVWHEGERVSVVRDPQFVGPARYLASLQDRQSQPPLRDSVTDASESGIRTSLSYLRPHTREDLDRKALASHAWMETTFGLMPRLPDFMSNVVVGLWDFRSRLAKVDRRFAENVEWFYEHARGNDLVLTHAIGDPQMDRSVSVKDNPDMALRVVDRSSDGMVVRGAKQLATLAPYSHELLVYLSPTYARRDLPEHVCWFSVPTNAEGLSLLCRPSMAGRHPVVGDLADRFDEQDAMVFFDDVFIPSHRVFLLDDAEAAFEGFWHLNKWALYVGQIRFHHRLRTTLAVARLAARAIGVDSFREIRSEIGEIAQYVEISRMCLDSMLRDASPTDYGLWAPGPTLAMDTFAAQVSGRLTEILIKISGSGAVMQASASDLEAPLLRDLVARYMSGCGVDAEGKAAVFRLVRGLVGTEFGARQHIYELWNRGDPVRNRMSLADAIEGIGDVERAVLDELADTSMLSDV